MTKSCFMIDAAKLDREIKAQGLKIWWLAEQLKVDRKTVTRWLHGKVKWIREDNLQALVSILNCPSEKLLRSEGVPLYTTTADQNLAAQSIAGHGLIRLLAPSGHFDLAESLIKALLSPDLPLRALAPLYIDLAHCCWQQNKLDEAQGYVDLVLGLQEQIQDPSLILKARQHLMTIHAKRGDLRQAIELADTCLNDPLIQQDPQTCARILFDLSEVIGHSAADIDKVILLRQEARHILAANHVHCDLHTALDELGLAYFLAEQDRLEDAERACRIGMNLATSLNFQQGIALAHLFKADIDSRYGRHKQAMDSLAQNYPKLTYGDMGLYASIGAAICRRAGYYEDALLYANQGLASHNPVFRAHGYQEAARVQSLLGYFHLASQNQRAAHDLYLQAGASARCRSLMNDGTIQVEPFAERA